MLYSGRIMSPTTYYTYSTYEHTQDLTSYISTLTAVLALVTMYVDMATWSRLMAISEDPH